jgi:hypothetical protein
MRTPAVIARQGAVDVQGAAGEAEAGSAGEQPAKE